MPPKKKLAKDRWSIKYYVSVFLFVMIMIFTLTSQWPALSLPILSQKNIQQFETFLSMEPKQQTIEFKEQRICTETETLVGPYQLDIMDRKEDDTRVILLSDIHIQAADCPTAKCQTSVVPYLVNLFDKYRGKEDINFFLEIDFEEKIRGMERVGERLLQHARSRLLQGAHMNLEYLTHLRLFFNDCFQRLKTKCEYHGRPIKFHYSDVRAGVLHSQIDKESETMIKELHTLRRLAHEEKSPSRGAIDILEKLLKKFEKKDVDFFFRISKIDKQLKEIVRQNPENKRLVTELYNIMQLHMWSEDTHDTINSMLNLISKLRSSRTQDITERFESILMTFSGQLLAPLFDIYTLARMIRHNMKQVIIYAGFAHTLKIREFLQSQMNYNLTISKESEKGEFQCLRMEKITQPWFK